MKNKDKTIIITLIFIVIIGGILLYKQGEDISNLKKSNKNIISTQKNNIINNAVNTNNISSSNEKIVEKDIKQIIKKEAFNQATETENQLTDNTKRITGTIISISNNFFKVKSSIVDISALKDIDYSKSTILPNIDKIFNIKITNNTKFKNISKKILEKGQIVDVVSKELIYKTNKLTAIEVNSFTNLVKYKRIKTD